MYVTGQTQIRVKYWVCAKYIVFLYTHTNIECCYRHQNMFRTELKCNDVPKCDTKKGNAEIANRPEWKLAAVLEWIRTSVWWRIKTKLASSTLICISGSTEIERCDSDFPRTCSQKDRFFENLAWTSLVILGCMIEALNLYSPALAAQYRGRPWPTLDCNDTGFL